jgi:ribosome biogenesis GTPase
MFVKPYSLSQLGWRPFYSQQLTPGDLETAFPARVCVVQRNLLVVLAERGEQEVTLPRKLRPDALEQPVTAGDWVLVQNETLRVLRLFDRHSLIARMAAGTEARSQSIAANVDTLLVVTSCNDDFNLSRLERYLSVALDARVAPVIVLTKADTCADPSTLIAQAQSIAAGVPVLALNATDAASSAATLSPWLGEGQTIGLVGSSGVGKSTLINALVGVKVQSTDGIREDDSKGRHTTTARYLLRTPGGSWLIDTPGMRELSVGAVQTGLRSAFVDIEALARECRFRDCRHQQDDGCALRSAVEAGRLEPRRLESYLKLGREAERASRTLWERHQEERRFGRLARAVQKKRRRDTGRE